MKIFITGSTLSTIHLKSSVIDSNYMVAYLLDEQLRTVLFKEKTSSFILPTPEAGNVSWGLVVDVDHLPSFERELGITDLIAQQDIYWESGVVFDLLGEECEAKVLRPSRIISFDINLNLYTHLASSRLTIVCPRTSMMHLSDGLLKAQARFEAKVLIKLRTFLCMER
ncbi:MAG: hypothetical protein ACKN9J_04465 [Holophagaceae bacterium]